MKHESICGRGHVALEHAELRKLAKLYHREGLGFGNQYTPLRRYILPLRYKQERVSVISSIRDRENDLTVATLHPFIQPLFINGCWFPIQIADTTKTKLMACHLHTIPQGRKMLAYLFEGYEQVTCYVFHNNKLVRDPVDELRKLQILDELS